MSLDAAPPPPSASTISAVATSGIHVIKLSGYSHAKLLLGTGESVKSAVFGAAGHSWRIKIYPNGGKQQCAPGSIALFLVLVNEPKNDVHADFEFSLVRHGSKLTAEVMRHGGRPFTFNGDRDAWGYEGIRDLEDPEFLKDDAILIRCDITVLNEPAVERCDLQALDDLLCECNDDGRCKKLHSLGGGGGIMKEEEEEAQSHSDMLQERRTPLPSASTIAVTASVGCHVVKVSGYSHTKLLLGNGEYIKSAEFKEAGHRWRTRCYPNGCREETAGHVSLYLELAGRSTDVHTRCQFTLVPHGHQLTTAPHGGTIGTGAARMTFGSRYTNNCFGLKDFLATEELERSEYLKDDSFYYRCDITAMNKPVVKLHDPEKLELLCYCNDDLCESIHAPAKMEAQAYGKPPRCVGLKTMLLSCIPVQAKSSQDPVFDVVEYSRV
jgi:hypothetical protein